MNLDHSSHLYSLIAEGGTPEKLKLVLISSDESKYTAFEKIRRSYLAVMSGHEDESAIIKSCDQLINILNSLMIVSQERIDMFEQVGVRSIMDYNSFVGESEHILPNIVVVIDDFADFIKEAGRRVERPLVKLARDAKRLGIYISLCTNQTSDDVITGAINSLVQEKEIDIYPPFFVGEKFLKLIDDIAQQEYSREQYILPYCKRFPSLSVLKIIDGFASNEVVKHFTCKHFCVVLYEDKYMFFNDEGLKTAEKTHDEVGDVISGGDNFVTHIGDDRLQFDGNGELKEKRPFTDEEKSQLKAAGLL